MLWFRLDDAGRGAGRKDSSNMITTALVAIFSLLLVSFIAYFVLARLGSLVWDVISRARGR